MSADTFEFSQGIRETLRGTLHDPAATPGNVLTVQTGGAIAAQPGGGGTAYATWVRVPIAFNMPGLEAGLLVYTPPDDTQYLLDAWIEVDVAWDGTTPSGDLSTADPGNIAATWGGFYNGFASAQDMNVADSSGVGGVGGPGVVGQGNNKMVVSLLSTTARIAPCRLLAAFPMYVCVSQSNGSPGVSPGGAAGSGTAVLLIGTP